VLHGLRAQYYTAVMAHAVGLEGRVLAYDVDAPDQGRRSEPASRPGRCDEGDAGTLPAGETFDAIRQRRIRTRCPHGSMRWRRRGDGPAGDPDARSMARTSARDWCS
jgi:hypothetical protein